MDPPESPPAGQPSLADASLYEDSPVFDFINSLSPIGTPKPLGPAQNVQLFKSSDLASVSSIFTSPQVNPHKETKPGIRDGYASSCIELSGSPTVALEICSPSEDATIFPSKWPQSIQLGSETLGVAKTQGTDGKADHGADVGKGKLSSSGYDQNGIDQMDLSTSGRNVQENEPAKQYNDDLAACSLNHLISHSGTGNGVMSKSSLSLEAQQLSWNLKCDDVIFSKSLMPVDQGNSEDSRRKLFDGSTGCYIQSAADNAHVQCAGAAEGVATNHGSEMLPSVIRSQLVSNEYFFDTFKVPSDGMALTEHECGMPRRSLFHEKVGSSDMSVQSGSNLHHANICGDDYLKPVGSPVYALSVSCSELYTRIHDDHSSQKTIPNADESFQESHKKRRRKLKNGDGDSCRHCSCKKSKCLKLYCACFAAKVYCSGYCSCQGCLNNHTHEETVSCIRKRTESRNPLAFAPTVTHACDSGSDFGGDPNQTPASARHKRGCNCRKSSCLKKYCECFQSGVGCSMSCRCEGCKNSFGKREGMLLATEKMEKGAKAKGTRLKEEKLGFDKQDVVGQSGDLPSNTENLFATPSLEPCRSSILLPSTSQSPMKADVLPPLETCAVEMILEDGSSNIQEMSSSWVTSVKVVSPNKKRVSPLHIGTRLSPIGRSGRKLVLKSIPSFPSLTGDADVSPTKQSSSAVGT
ncbi:unnamed protein product [Urochloa decumbens]|uniref:CRC domain-containing protein n=1 Tax=Urochloa decumbens TaxID=240449 RepID=A0ABC8Y0J9_9POAL